MCPTICCSSPDAEDAVDGNLVQTLGILIRERLNRLNNLALGCDLRSWRVGHRTLIHVTQQLLFRSLMVIMLGLLHKVTITVPEYFPLSRVQSGPRLGIRN